MARIDVWKNRQIPARIQIANRECYSELGNGIPTVYPMDPAAAGRFHNMNREGIALLKYHPRKVEIANAIAEMIRKYLPALSLPRDVDATLEFAPLVLQIVAARTAQSGEDGVAEGIQMVGYYLRRRYPDIPGGNWSVQDESALMELAAVFPYYGPYKRYLEDQEISVVVRRLLRLLYRSDDYDYMLHTIRVAQVPLDMGLEYLRGLNDRFQEPDAIIDRLTQDRDDFLDFIFGNALENYSRRSPETRMCTRILNSNQNHWVAVRSIYDGRTKEFQVQFYDSLYDRNLLGVVTEILRVSGKIDPRSNFDQIVVPLVETSVQPDTINCGYMAACFAVLAPQRPLRPVGREYVPVAYADPRLAEELRKGVYQTILGIGGVGAPTKRQHMQFIHRVCTPLRGTLEIRDFWGLIGALLQTKADIRNFR